MTGNGHDEHAGDARDLHELLMGAAGAARVSGPSADGLRGRVRRRRAVRTGVRSAAGVGAAGALVLAAVQAPSVLGGAAQDSSADGAPPGASADAGAGTGATALCGSPLADLDATRSAVDARVRLTAMPAATGATGSGTLDVALAVGSSSEERVDVSFAGATVVLTHDGVVAAARDVLPDALADLRVREQHAAFVWTDVPLSGCADGAALDGDYELWVLAHDDGGSLLGGGVPVVVSDGAVPSLCGTDLRVPDADAELEVSGSIEVGSLDADGTFVAGAGTGTLWLTSHVEARPGESDAGVLDDARLVLTDADGVVVLDAATSSNASRSASWYDLPAVGLGAERVADATGCDGAPLPAGDYEAWDVRSVASWDADAPGGRRVVGSAGGFSFGSGSSAP